MARFWKSLKYRHGKIISEYDNSEWKIGGWRTVPAPKKECEGLNACENILDAIGYVKPDIIAEVEIFGGCIKGDDKVTCERMRIIHAWITPPKLYAEMAIYAAGLVLELYEKKYPDGKRPREAIEKAQACVDMMGGGAAADAAHAARAAAYAADAAYAARAAAHAADAAHAAHAAAYAARAAAHAADAAYAARAAAHAADAARAAQAAYAAAYVAEDKENARAKTKQKIERWIIDHITALPEMS